MPQKFKQN